MESTIESPSPSVSMCKKEDMRKCLRAEVHSLVEPLIDKLLAKLNTSTTTPKQSQSKHIAHNNNEQVLQFHLVVTDQLADADELEELSESEFANRLIVTHSSVIQPDCNNALVDSQSTTNEIIEHEKKEETHNEQSEIIPRECPSISTSLEYSNQSSDFDDSFWNREFDYCVNEGRNVSEDEDKCALTESDEDESVERTQNGDKSCGTVNVSIVQANSRESPDNNSEQHQTLRKQNLQIQKYSLNIGDIVKAKSTQSQISEKQSIVLQLQCLETGCSQMFVESKFKPALRQLNEHMSVEHGIDLYRCQVKYCDQSYPSQFALTRHINQEHTDRVWHCSKCAKHFPTYNQLSVHNSMYHRPGLYQCSFADCYFTSVHRKDVSFHFQQQHKHEPICPHYGCERTYKSASGLETHLRAHHMVVRDIPGLGKVSLFVVPSWPESEDDVRTKARIQKDENGKIHKTPNEIIPTECPPSSKSISKTLNSNQSNRIELTESKRVLIESDEMVKSTKKDDKFCQTVNEHKRIDTIQSNHQTESPNHQTELSDNKEQALHEQNLKIQKMLDILNKPKTRCFPSKPPPSPAQLHQMHLQEIEDRSASLVHSNKVNILQLDCLHTGCSQVFLEDNKLLAPAFTQLNKHMYNDHGIDLYRCLVKNCVQSFSYKNLLSKHNKQKHSGECSCAKCPEHFPNNQRLGRHYSNYHRPGLFECTFADCGFTGNLRMTVFEHYQEKHPEIYYCQYSDCERTFKSFSSLKDHLLVHWR